jgi:hypothetical protein
MFHRLAHRCLRLLRERPYSLAAVLLFTVLLWPFMKKSVSQWDLVYVAAAERLVEGGNLFVNGYFYPPFMAFLAIPFTWLPAMGSRFVWYLVNVVCLVLLWKWAWRLAGGGPLEGSRGDWRERLACLLGLAVAVRYGFDGLQNQQTDMVIGMLLLGGCLLLIRARPFSSATMFGLAAAMKCTPLLWAPYLLWRRHWLAALWLPCLAIGVNLLPELIRSPDEGGTWFSKWTAGYLAPMGQDEAEPGRWPSAIIYNQSLAGGAHRAFVVDPEWNGHMFKERPRNEALSPQVLKGIVYGGELALLFICSGILLLSRRWHGQQRNQVASLRPALEFSVVLVLMPLLSPMSSKPHFCTLLVPAFLLARLVVYRRSWVLAVLLALAILASVLATKDLAGEYLASLAMWHGGVTISASLLLTGCLYALAGNLVAVAASAPEAVPQASTMRAAA